MVPQILVFSHNLPASAFSESLKISSTYLSRLYEYIPLRDTGQSILGISPRITGHFILSPVLRHLVLHFRNYKYVYFHVSSFFLFMVSSLAKRTVFLMTHRALHFKTNIFSGRTLLIDVRSSHLAIEKCSF